MNPLLIKNFVAGAAINPSRFVKIGAADGEVLQASDASAAVLGASVEKLTHAAGERCDVITHGIAYVAAGGSINRGAVVIPDADAKAVAASVVAGSEQHVGGIALVAAAAGDVIPVLLTPGAVIATDAGIVEVDVTLSSAQILALNATPIELVAAPGAGKVLLLEGAQRAMLDYNSAAYAGIAAGEDLAIRYDNGSGGIAAQFETTGWLDQTADGHRVVYPQNVTPIENKALVAHMTAGEITTGNSPIKLKVRYRVADMLA